MSVDCHLPDSVVSTTGGGGLNALWAGPRSGEAPQGRNSGVRIPGRPDARWVSVVQIHPSPPLRRLFLRTFHCIVQSFNEISPNVVPSIVP
jgi:hypothetical protein